MKFEVWKQTGDEHCSKSLVMFPALHRENEEELIRKGYQVCHVFEAPSNERAQSMMADWITEQSGLPEMVKRAARYRARNPRDRNNPDDCWESGLPPAATHPIEARIADEAFGPPRTIPLDDAAKAAIENHMAKHRCDGRIMPAFDGERVVNVCTKCFNVLDDRGNPTGENLKKSGTDCQKADVSYVTALENDNADFLERQKQLIEAAKMACYAMTLRYGDSGDLNRAYEAVEDEHGGAMAAAYVGLRKALDLRLGVETSDPEGTEKS